MASRRLARLGEQLKREISTILRHEVRDPRIGFPVVTGVEVTSDLWLARVYVQLTGGEEERRETMEGLEAAAPFIRRTLGEELHIRRVPELQFHQDRSLERARRIEEILEEVGPDDGAEGGEGAAHDPPPPPRDERKG